MRAREDRQPSRADVIAALMERVIQCPKHSTRNDGRPRPAHPIVYTEEMGWVCDRCGPVIVAKARLPKE